jgi:Fe-coproporphyrin III synthase
MISQSIYHTYKRYSTLRTNRISALPIVILMPHSACNCKCVMCDIWKGNKNLKQLEEEDITGLLSSLRKFGTKQVLMSGGEALLNPAFFRLCELLKKEGLSITLLSTGLTIKRNSDNILKWIDELIVSLDGDEVTHDATRNVAGAFQKLKEGVQEIKLREPNMKILARTVIHRLNFRKWPEIIKSAREIGVDSISFLPADVSSHAFNREVPWTQKRQMDVAVNCDELSGFKDVLDEVIESFRDEIECGFVVESAEKLKRMYTYYCAVLGLCDFPYKKCNAPWVSTVIEADGTVRPCFFHAPIGNIRKNTLTEVLNGEAGTRFRKELDMDENDTCKSCVCYLNLSAGVNPSNK